MALALGEIWRWCRPQVRSLLVRPLSLLSPAWPLSLHQAAVLGLRSPSLTGSETLCLEGPAAGHPVPPTELPGPRHVNGRPRVGRAARPVSPT